jgi:adenylate cyclase
MEIERKFLLDAPPDGVGDHPSSTIRQGYLAIEPGGTEVRVRRRDGEATLTAKAGTGRTRAEVEIAIDAETFERLWPLTAGRRIEKVRHLVPAGDGLTVELDVYGGDLAGLVVGEVEFPDEAAADAFAPPAWLGVEVTDDERYKNHRLAVDGRPA